MTIALLIIIAVLLAWVGGILYRVTYNQTLAYERDEVYRDRYLAVQVDELRAIRSLLVGSSQDSRDQLLAVERLTDSVYEMTEAMLHEPDEQSGQVDDLDEQESQLQNSIQRGLADSIAGRVQDLGSFAKYVKDEQLTGGLGHPDDCTHEGEQE